MLARRAPLSEIAANDEDCALHRPHAEPEPFHAVYPARAGSVADARQAVADLAHAGGARGEQLDGIRIAVSEAVTNAVVHAYSGAAGEVAVRAELASGCLEVTVTDAGSGAGARAARRGLGVGMVLMTQLSDDVTIVEGDDGGTTVRLRFELRRPAD